MRQIIFLIIFVLYSGGYSWHFLDDVDAVRMMYRHFGGDYAKAQQVRGFMLRDRKEVYLVNEREVIEHEWKHIRDEIGDDE